MAKSRRFLAADGDLEGAIRTFLADLLRSGQVQALLVPKEVPAGDNVVQTIVVDPEDLERVCVLAPVMPVNSARIVSSLTKVTPTPRKMGVVGRPCEMRALVELVKLKQASMENLILIGMDCHGTYSVKDYASRSREGKATQPQRSDEDALRTVCQICEYPYPLNADIALELFDPDGGKTLWIRSRSDVGEKVLAALGFEEGTGLPGREKDLTELVSRRKEKRDQVFQEMGEKVKGLENLLSVFSTCINCHNCMTACPLCYCKECFFNSSTFDWEAEKYLEWAERAGALHMPTDTLLFHLTRLVHMVHSCVGCGSCEEACPNGIPVAEVFRLVGRDVQALFDYVPGKSLEEPIPVASFREDELQTVG